MRALFKSKKRVVLVLLVFCAIAIAVLATQFAVMEMVSTSMEPLISGQGKPPSRRGDLLIIKRWFRISSLRTGDLVVVDIPAPNGRVRTVRKIDQQPDTPAGQFYVRAVSKTGIDSRSFGPLPAQDIRGRVVWIIRRS